MSKVLRNIHIQLHTTDDVTMSDWFSEMDGFTTFAIHDSLGFTSCLWWFDSTQFIFSGCSKETRSPIPNYIMIEVNDSSVILSELWQTGADSTQFNSFIRNNAKCCKYTLCIFSSSPPILLSKSVAKQSVIWCCWHFKELHWFPIRWMKTNILPAPLSSLYH